MACGTPVVTSNVSSMPDVAGKAALFVDPTDEAAMAEAITRVATDDALSAALRRLGLAHAPGYSWARAAGEVLDILDEARGDG